MNLRDSADGNVRVQYDRWGTPRLNAFRIRLIADDGDTLTYYGLCVLGPSISVHPPAWLVNLLGRHITHPN